MFINAVDFFQNVAFVLHARNNFARRIGPCMEYKAKKRLISEVANL